MIGLFELLEAFLFFGNGMGIGMVLALFALPTITIFNPKTSSRSKAIATLVLFVPAVIIIGLIVVLILKPHWFYIVV